MRATLIYDLRDLLHRLEVDVIYYLLNTGVLDLQLYTVDQIKRIWLTDRLEEMHLVAFDPNHAERMLDVRRFEDIKRMARDLDRLLYSCVRIPAEISCLPARLELRRGDLYLYFSSYNEKTI